MFSSLFPSAVARSNGGRSRRAFTLVELLVVIGIIALLISILMPALRRAREQANSAKCMSNQRQIMMAFLMFASEHRNHLPGNWWDHQRTDRDERAWLINAGEPFMDAPQNGTIWRYLKNYEVYRCPALIQHGVGEGSGSNGRFDYASFIVFSGAKTTQIKPESRFLYNGVYTYMPTPIVCDEEPQGGINGGNNEGGHCNTDRLGHDHRGGGHYASIDGSVHWFIEPKDANSWNWESLSPRRGWITLGSVETWGYWGR